jgi:transcriptional antiterminator RfaH
MKVEGRTTNRRRFVSSFTLQISPFAMPILDRESDIYPEHLLEPAGEGGEPWWALYTMPRREKELMRRLRALELPFYGPIVPQRKKSPQGRVRTSYLPLFSGYVFLRGDDESRRQALTSNCISRCLMAPDAGQLVEDLRQIRRLILADVPLTVEAQIQPGARVRVRSGALRGIEGVVLRREHRDRLLVAVRFLQQGASLLLGDFEVEEI